MLARLFGLALLFAFTYAGLTERRQRGHDARQKCSFLKSLIDKRCKAPKLENGISIKVEKGQCYSKLKWHKINIKGCKPRKIMSRDCIGRCNSVWIPGPEIGKLGCVGCFPSEYEQSPVTFDCPKRKSKKLTRMVVLAKSCKCQSFKCTPFVKTK